MDGSERLAQRFEEHRPRLRAVAYRMLGSTAEADDAVQETWLRLSRAGDDEIDNLDGWLTTVLTRICLNVLRSAEQRRVDTYGVHLPDPMVVPDRDLEPDQEAILADSISLALLVVLDTLTPGERLAYVLHDMFALSFEEVAAISGRTAAAARQRASRARRRVREAAIPPVNPDRRRGREVVDAFFAAARGGDLEALARVLDPDVVLRADYGDRRRGKIVRGVTAVSKMARAPQGAHLHRVLVNGAPGAVVTIHGRPFSLMAFAVTNGRIIEIDAITDPERVARIASPVLG